MAQRPWLWHVYHDGAITWDNLHFDVSPPGGITTVREPWVLLPYERAFVWSAGDAAPTGGGGGPLPEVGDFLDLPNAERCWLLEIQAFPLAPIVVADSAVYAGVSYGELAYAEGDGGAEGSLATLYFSDRGYTSHPTDTPESLWYEGRLMAGFRVERRIIGRDGIGGITRVASDGALVNDDGGLDTLRRDYSIEGRSARFYVGRPTDARADFILVASGIIERVWTDLSSMRINFSDGVARLDRMVNQVTYSGSGVTEGGADLKGKYKPKCYGDAENVSPPLVNNSLLIYQVNDGSVNDVTAVYDRGISLTKGSDYTSLTDMETNAPSAGNYRVWKAGGYFRLGSTPAGTVTADVEGDDAGGYITKTAEIVERILESQALFSAAEINETSFAQMNVDASAEVGIWIGTEGQTIEAVINSLLIGAGAFGGFSRLGEFTVGVVYAPPSLAVASFTEEDIFEIERLPLPSSIEPIIWRAQVAYQRNYTVQSDLAAGVTAARRSYATESQRTETLEDASVSSRYILAKEYAAESFYRDQADAVIEASRLIGLWGAPRSIFRVVVPIRAIARDLGEVVNIKHPRHGLTNGVYARIIGHAIAGQMIELTVLV
jgi:hypothetical protein